MNKEIVLSRLNFKSFYQTFIPSLKINGKAEAMGLCPFHDDHSPSLSVNVETGLYNCFACGAGGDAFTLYQKIKGVDFSTALKEIGEMQGIAPVKGKVVATFEYMDAAGTILYVKERISPGRGGKSKEFFFKHLDDNNKWITGRGCEPVPYNLPLVVKSKYVLIVEGEAKADLLTRQLGLSATCFDSGAQSPFRDDYLKDFEGKEKVVILPDNDSPGKKYANNIANALYGKVKTIKIVELPGLPEAGDIIDWTKITGNDKDKLLELIKNTPEWQPEGKTTQAETTDILSCLEKWSYIQSLDIKIEEVVNRLIPKESIIVFFGKSGIGKTWLMLDMAKSIGGGIPFLGLATKKTPVVFVDFENPLAVLNTRTQKLGDAEGVYFWRANNEKMKSPKLDSKDWELYKSLPNGAVLIFDTLRASHDKDENASNDMALIMGRLKELRDMGFTIILLHHTPKNSDRLPKGSTAIVDLADHILGMTLVRKKQDGQEVIIEDEDNEDDAIYRFGVREKTRFEPYHIYLTLNPDRGFELAPDPQEDTLKKMHSILLEHGQMTKTSFAESCKGLGAVNKIRKLIDIGQGRYWDIEKRPDQKNAQFVVPQKSVLQFYAPYSAVKLKNCPDSPVKLDTAKITKTLDTVEFDSFTPPPCKTEKLDLQGQGDVIDLTNIDFEVVE